MTEKEKFRAIRLDQKLNQKTMAEAIGLPQTSLSDIETGRVRVSQQTKLLMKYVFSVNPGYWEGEDEMYLPKEKPGHDPIYEQIIEQKDEEIKMLKRIVELLEDKVDSMTKQAQKKS